ncbi:hypothetical protein J0H33_16475, partial [bacterium]|nr:hypothetical protein [bacterium]
MDGVPMNVTYRGIQCRGRPDDVVSEISQVVSQTHGLRKLVPRVCHEKSRGNRIVEFYLFVGHLDPDDHGDRAALDGFFAAIAHRSWHGAVLGEFPREQIRTMVGQDIRVEEFARRLRYKPLVLPDAGDPFAEEDDDIVRLDDLELTGRFDRLLWWMSAHGEGSFSTLDSARRALGIEMDTRRALRALRM